MAAAVKASHNQLPFLGKQASMEVADQNHSLGGILQNAEVFCKMLFCKSLQNSCKTPVPECLFNKAAG